MNFNLRKSIFGLFLIAATAISAQAQSLSGGIRTNTERCKSAILHKQLMQTDPQYAARIRASEAQIQQVINSGVRAGGIYTIPVVVHVLHLGESVGTGTNISLAQINSAIDNLNDCYGGIGSYPTDVEVQFQLAQRDPFCNATTGIVRVDASGVSDYSTNGITTANELTIKAISSWPNSEYYNIWIVSEIDGNNGGSGTQGYAYFPGASSGRDGAVILYNSFGYDPTGALGYNLKSYTRHNATTNHELGHAFDLYHTFEGDDANDDGIADQCPVNTACTTDGDLCCDTEAHKRDDGDCGATGTTCTGQSIVTIVENIMAYSSDACQVRFTADQKTRMRAAISVDRASLLTSPGLLPITGSAPSASKACSPQTTNLSNGFGMGVFGLTIGSTSYSSSGAVAEGGFRETWCNNFSLATNTLYSITVNNGSLNNEKVKVYIDYNNDGDFEDTGENVYSDNTGALTHTGSFTTPVSPVTGQALWVRVISDFVNFTISNSCYAPTYGQVEDFSVTITGGCTAPTITGTTPGSRCGTGTVVLGATASAGTLNWYAASTGGSSLGTGTSYTTPSISSTTTYYVDATNGGCTSARSAVIATVNPGPSISSTTPGSRCDAGTIVLGATASAGTLNWYAASTGGSSLGTGTSYTTPSISSTTTYYVDATDGGCTTSRSAVTATVNATPTVSSTTPGSRCGTGTVVLGATASAGTLNWYAASTGGSSLGTGTSYTTPSISSTTTYYVDATNGGCTSVRSAVIATVNSCVGTTQLNSTSCGATGLSISSYIYCNPVSGATDYEFTISNTSLGYSQVRYRVTYAAINLNSYSGLAYGQTYDVTVRAKVGGVWGASGSSCPITLMAQPSTQLNTSSCGATGLSISSYIYCNAISGTTEYEFTLSNTSLGYSQVKYRTTYAAICLNSYTGLVYGETYDVTVRSKVGGVWGPVGASCPITLMAIPSTQLKSTSCGATGLSMTSYIYCDAVAGASDYEFTLSNSTLGYSQIKYRVSYAAINLNSYTGLIYGETYDVSVRAKVSGVWGPTGVICQVTLASSPLVNQDLSDKIFTEIIFADQNSKEELSPVLLAYPNPSGNDGFDINIAGLEDHTDIILTVFDIYGKAVYTKMFNGQTNGQIVRLNTDGSLSKGIYMINVQTQGKSINQKVIIQ